ncbi:hypothetical protein NRIC_08710 [Enterococcus florum]|uniref:Core domain-containing protein n=1 Tax=Enterococcus florum TaxID=2480627 RepID=A0A4P5P5L4_9ENTE|nr:iron-sulfur cluster biosynthesis family protein [Enterococcus florum]GCF92980.1 hypothetical protein NRIC_08710 [Enterococcus florum]
MNIRVSESAATALKTKLNSSSFILALNDGSNQFSTVGGSCAIGDKFQIFATDGPKDNYTEKLAGKPFEIYISDGEKLFLGEEVLIDFNQRLNSFVLKNESGILDNNILVKA